MSSPRGRVGRVTGLFCNVLLIATACQPASASPTAAALPPVTHSPSASSPTPIPINIPAHALKGVSLDVWYPWFGVEESLFQSEVQEFNRSNEWGITVNATSQGSYSELDDTVSSVVSGPLAPDLVVALPAQALAWDAVGHVVDLTPYVDDPQYGLTPAEQDDFPMVFWSQDEVAGRRLGIPAERSARFMIYDQTWAQELGFASPPRNADDFRQQACRAHQAMQTDASKANDGMGGWLVDSSGLSFVSWMMAFGGGVVDGNGYRFLTPNNLTALTFVKQLYDDGCAWTAQPDADLPAAFAARDALFATASLEQLSDFSRAMGVANNGDDWTVLGYPGPVQPGLLTYGSSYVVLKSNEPQQLAAWLFVRWLLSAENQKDWVETTGMFPLRTSELPLLESYRQSHPQWSAGVDLLPHATIQPQLASWRQVSVMIGDGFSAMFRSNTPTGRVAEILAIMGSTAGDLSK